MADKLTRYVYDVESFKNLFTVALLDIETEEEYVFVVGLGRDDSISLTKFLTRNIVLVGYNNHSYDDPVLRYFTDLSKKDSKNIPEKIYEFSALLIDDNYRQDQRVLKYRYPRHRTYAWNSIDLMRILAFDKLGISLKQTAINLKWHKIQDIPLSPTRPVKEKDLDLIVAYNMNDVRITKRLYEEITPLRELRNELSKLYRVNLTSASDSKMANLILEKIYGSRPGVNISSLRSMRTRRQKVVLGDCVAPFVKFETVELKELLDRISTTIVRDYNRYRYSEKISFAGCEFVLGIGGLHSSDKPGLFSTDKDFIIRDADVASYYPNLIINNKFYPEHLGEEFIDVLKTITAERISAKKSGDKTKADGLKITINSIFGKMGSEHFWLLDPKQMLSTTISGQMGLLMLVESMYLAGIHVLSCNTDGIICKIPRALEDKYYEICKEWEKKTSLELEFTTYKKYVRRDVNSYITVKEDGSTKKKGAFLTTVDLKRAYNMPIVAECIYEYFVNGIPVKETLKLSKDIMDFCYSQKIGKSFDFELHTVGHVEPLQRTNRFYVSNTGGALVKRQHFTKKPTGLLVGYSVSVLNDYDPSVPFENYDVNLYFYEKEAYKIIDEIEPKQMTLLSMDNLDPGRFNKREVETKEIDLTSIKAEDLYGMGKNQLAYAAEVTAGIGETIEGISPRYVYIENFSGEEMAVQAYCLAKGVSQRLYIPPEKYNERPVSKGMLLYCGKFEKHKDSHMIVEYDYVTTMTGEESATTKSLLTK